MDFKEKDAVVYVPQHIRKGKELPKQFAELKGHKEVEYGVVTEVNSPSQIVFVLFKGDFNAKACYPRDLIHDPGVPKEEAPTPTPTPTGTQQGATSAEGTATQTAGAGPANKPA